MAAEQQQQVAENAPIVYYYLSGSDGTSRIRISELASAQSKTISDLVLNLGYEDSENEPAIPLSNIQAKTLEKVVEWCEHHKGEAPLPDDENVPKRVEIPAWDMQFLTISDDDLFDLVIAANYLDIKTLLTYCCKKIALMAKGKSPEELRVIYEIPTDEEDERMERQAAGPSA